MKRRKDLDCYCNDHPGQNCHGECGCADFPFCEHGPFHGHKGICTAVVDDANDRVYLYGDVVHENYHEPHNGCIAWAAVGSAGFEHSARTGADEFFDGEHENNNIELAHVPYLDNSFLVFLNGVKQRYGANRDYTVNGKILHFNFYDLLPTDCVEVMYEYREV